jgi:hypothetical protein
MPEVAEAAPQQPAAIEREAAAIEAVDAEAPATAIVTTEMPEAGAAGAELPVTEMADNDAEIYPDDFRMVPQSPEPLAAEDLKAETPTPAASDGTAAPDEGTPSLVRKVRNWLRRAA